MYLRCQVFIIADLIRMQSNQSAGLPMTADAIESWRGQGSRIGEWGIVTYVDELGHH